MNDISKKLASIEKVISAIKGNMATKDDIKNMATKQDLKTMATKDDIKGMATKQDLKAMATKKDLKSLESKLLERMEESQMEIIAAVDKHKADKESIIVLEKRVERLEDNAGLPPYADQ